MSSKRIKAKLAAGMLLTAAVAGDCNVIRDVILVPEGGNTCSGGDFGMPCTGQVETGVLIADVQTEFVWA